MSHSVFAPHSDPNPRRPTPHEGAVAGGKRGLWQRRPQRRETDPHWLQGIVPDILDNLREHSVFLLDNTVEKIATPSVGRGALASQLLREADREKLYEFELLRIFRSRIRLVGGLGLIFLPIFTAFYFFLAPQTSGLIVVISALIMMSLLVCMAVSGLINRLLPMRVLVQVGYLIFCLGNAAQIPIIAGDVASQGEASRAVLLVLSSSFIHILLSILLLPFTFGETMLTTVLTIGILSWGLSAAGLDADPSRFEAQFFLTLTTSFLVVLISHLGCLLRRRAFHSAFDLALQAAHMQQVSATDLLTSGFNRRYIENLLGVELARANRFSHPISVLMFDLDNFKPVNDTLGHAAGDEVLRQVWTASCAALREVDTLARFGGDEFLIVLPETAAFAARGIADRLRAVVTSHLCDRWGPDSIEGRVTLSIGVLTLDGQEIIDVDAALTRTDALLYEAKRDGKNRTVVG